MLNAKDLCAIREVMQEVMREEIAESEERMTGKIAESEERMQGAMRGAIAESEERMTGKIAESEEQTRGYIDSRVTESENLILKYVDDTRTTLENKIQMVQDNLNEITQYYRIKRLEDENISYLIRKTGELDIRVEKLEKIAGKTA